MSQIRKIVRDMNRYETRLGTLLKSKDLPKTVKPRFALAGNNPSHNKSIRRAQHKVEQTVKLARVVVACLITAAGGGHIAQPVAINRNPALKLDAYHRRIYERGTVLRAPGFDPMTPAAFEARQAALRSTQKKRNPRVDHRSRHQRCIRQVRKQAVAA